MKNPTVCNICDSPLVRFTSNSEIYGKEYGNGKCFLCDSCGAYVGCHDNGKTLGILSDEIMRAKKKECHALFDPLWREKKTIKRKELYSKLAKKMGIKVEECHFGYFDLEKLNRALSILRMRFWYIETD